MREKDDLSGAPAAIGMVILAMLFLGLVFAIYPGWAVIGDFLSVNLRLTADAPTWVQAVGSIGAIVGVWWQTKRQLSATKDSGREEEVKKSAATLRRSLFLIQQLQVECEKILALHGNFLIERKRHGEALSKVQMITLGTVTAKSDFLQEDLNSYRVILDSALSSFSDLPYWDIKNDDLANMLLDIRSFGALTLLVLVTQPHYFVKKIEELNEKIKVAEDLFLKSV